MSGETREVRGEEKDGEVRERSSSTALNSVQRHEISVLDSTKCALVVYFKSETCNLKKNVLIM